MNKKKIALERLAKREQQKEILDGLERKSNAFALTRAKRLARVPEDELPKVAFAYVKEMQRLYGAFRKIKFVALAHYAQLEEHLSCHKQWYIPSAVDTERFRVIRCSVKSVH